jgi:hypothetical protein
MSPTDTTNEFRHTNSSSSSGAPVSDQYPPRTSYQEAATALIDSYRPSASSHSDSGNQRLSSSHKADIRQNPEKHPAEALREHRHPRNGRGSGRLSPIRDIDMDSTVSAGVKRERDTSPAVGEDMQLSLRPQAKRPCAADFIGASEEDHYP